MIHFGRQLSLEKLKVEVSAQHAQESMDAVEEIHNMFWAVKGREVLGLEQADCMKKMQVTIRGDMWPSLKDGQEIICSYNGQTISLNQW